MKADGRPVRPGEVPRFGSVWTWGDGPALRYIALRVEQGVLHYLDVDGRVDPYRMRWSAWDSEGEPLPQWRCVAEAPR